MPQGSQTLAAPVADRKRQIAGLDLIRLAAALLVVGFHLGFWIFRDPNVAAPIPRSFQPFQPLFSRGWVGVEIFFVLSGFVIAYSTEGATPGRFVRHRLTRLLPAALICASLTAGPLLRIYPAGMVAAEWLRSISFWPVGPWIDGSYWTLPIEVAFYALVWAVLLFRRGRYMEGVMAVLGVLSAITRVLVLFEPTFVPRPVLDFLISAGFPPRACLLLNFGTFFALGVFLFLLLLHGWTALRGVVATFCLVGCLAEVIAHERGLAGVVGRSPSSGLPVALWSASVLLLIASTAGNQQIQQALGPRGGRVARTLGLMTYPLYLLHVSLGEQIIAGLHRHIGYGAAFVVALTFVLALAYGVSTRLEPPLRRGLQGLLHRPATSSQVTVT